MNKKILLVIFYLTLLLIPLSAKTIQNQSQFKFNVDYACFRTSSDFTYLEVYYSVYRDQLTFIPDNNQFYAEFRIQTSIYLIQLLGKFLEIMLHGFEVYTRPQPPG